MIDIITFELNRSKRSMSYLTKNKLFKRRIFRDVEKPERGK